MNDLEKKFVDDLESIFFEVVRHIKGRKGKVLHASWQGVVELFGWRERATKRYSLWFRRDFEGLQVVIILTGTENRCRISVAYPSARTMNFPVLFAGLDVEGLLSNIRALET